MYLLKRHIPNLSILLINAAIFLGSVSCTKDNVHVIPDVYVDIHININDPEFFALRAENNSVKVTSLSTGGYHVGYDNNGILVYNNGAGEFLSFDCTCTYQVEKSVSVYVFNNGPTAQCPDCNSEFVLPSNGLPAYGSAAEFPLKEYKTAFNPNTGDIHIFN